MNRREQSNFDNWLDDGDEDDDFDVVAIVRDEGLEEIELEYQKKLARLEGEFERKKRELLAERDRKRKGVLKVARTNSRNNSDAGGTGGAFNRSSSRGSDELKLPSPTAASVLADLGSDYTVTEAGK